MLRAGVSRLRPIVGMARTVVTRHTFIPKAVIGGASIGLGDVVVQRFENKVVGKTQYAAWLDPERSGRMFKVGVALCAVCLKWYEWLDKRFPRRDMRTVARKVFLDAVVMAPILIVLFVGGIKLLEGSSVRESLGGVRKAIGPMYTLLFWSVAQAFNFALVPPHYRLVYLAVLSMVYDDIILSYFHHVYLKNDHPESETEESGDSVEGNSNLEAGGREQGGEFAPVTAAVIDFIKETVVDEECFENVEREGAEDSNTDSH